ncbi:MAG TPA: EAL domain-containing protein [Gallionellaceae bacterium]
MISNATQRIKRNTILAIAAWVLFVGLLLWWNIHNAEQQMLATAEKEAKGYLKQDLAFRRWATSHGGLYVPVDDKNQPSPYLKNVPERDIRTPSGRLLTLQNPATSLREIKETQYELYGMLARITAPKYLNPANAPDEWERKALSIVARSASDYTEISQIDGKPYLRMMQPMLMEQGCISCHGSSGVKVGELHGGTDVAIPLEPYQLLFNRSRVSLGWTHGAVFVLGLLFIAFFSRRSLRHAAEEVQYVERLAFFEKIFENSSEGLLVTDEHNSIVSVNAAFTAITGYTFDEVQGKDPRIFSSGRHDRAFYQQMWHELLSNGNWKGEIWDRHKNGEVHAKYLSINTIRNQDGSVHRFVALFSDITQRKRSEELIWKQANFDVLTDLPNRRMYRERLELDLKVSAMTKMPLALLLIDLDQFKEVNDTLGHAVGDVLLKEAAHRIRACVRTSDTVARLGGDEFMVTLAELSEPEQVGNIAQQMLDRLSEHFNLGGEVVYISASIGITLYPDDGHNIDDLLKNADQAMYVAKRHGRNRYSYFTQSLQENAQKRLRLVTDMRVALAHRQFRVYYQPIVDLGTGSAHKVEALLRWQHPELGMVSPLEFISLAEEVGLINEIGDWVFREAAGRAKRWSELFGHDFQVSVNKSPVQFHTEGANYAAAWLAYLHELGLTGRNVVVEITEGVLLNAESNVTDRLLAFRDAGIQVAIDDFGTGYSALSYLKKFDIDYLKIDQVFVRNLENDHDDLALCEAIIIMAHKLGLKVIAEGVETTQQRDMLAAIGCDYAQGYLFSCPLPAEEIEKVLLALNGEAVVC